MPDLAASRYVALIDQIGKELGYKYGWKSEVARRLDTDQSYVSKLVTGERTSVGRRTIEKASESLGLDLGFFYDSSTPESYRANLKGAEARTELDRPVPDAVHQVIEDLGDRLSGWAKGELLAQNWHPEATTYRAVRQQAEGLIEYEATGKRRGKTVRVKPKPGQVSLADTEKKRRR